MNVAKNMLKDYENVSTEDKQKFLDRLNSYPESLRDRVKSMYAAPYFNKNK